MAVPVEITSALSDMSEGALFIAGGFLAVGIGVAAFMKMRESAEPESAPQETCEDCGASVDSAYWDWSGCVCEECYRHRCEDSENPLSAGY